MEEQIVKELHNIGAWLGWIATWLFWTWACRLFESGSRSVQLRGPVKVSLDKLVVTKSKDA